MPLSDIRTVIIRKAVPSDFKRLYKIGKSTPELRVSRNQVFMTEADFKFAIGNKSGLFLLAEDGGKIVGFGYCAIEGPDYACMVYDVVIPGYRDLGIAGKFMKEKEKWLRRKGMKSVYALVTNPKMAGMLSHLGYKKGKGLLWMEKWL